MNKLTKLLYSYSRAVVLDQRIVLNKLIHVIIIDKIILFDLYGNELCIGFVDIGQFYTKL